MRIEPALQTPDSALGAHRIFSLVSAVYNVERYLDDFFASIERQTYGIENLDVILVDDGSTDGSGTKSREFAAKWPMNVRVLSKENGGHASARNHGLTAIRGDWVTFPDPDDILDDEYFAEVNTFLDRDDAIGTTMCCVTTIMQNDRTGARTDSHPLRAMFRYGNRIIDLGIEPDCIQLSATRSIFRSDLAIESGLRFDERIRPNFEDVHFAASYLLTAGQPRIAAIATARYYYRKRADSSSTLQSGGAHPERYVVVPRIGFLGLLESAQRIHGTIPDWLQYLVLYHLAWYLRADAAPHAATGSLSPDVTNEFHALAARIRRHISAAIIERFSTMPISDEIRFALLHGYSAEPFAPSSVRLGAADLVQGLIELRYYYTGMPPAEEIWVDGTPVTPIHAKARSLEYYGRTLAYERILWVPYGNRTTMKLNGRPCNFLTEVARVNAVVERHLPLGRSLAIVNRRPEPLRHPQESLGSRFVKRYRRLRRATSREARKRAWEFWTLSISLHSSITRRAFGNAWVFMDKDSGAGDSGEYLYRYVVRNHPEVNAWFVLNRDSPDWDRLRAEKTRLIAYGSFRWRLLMLSASHVASSYVDDYISRPLPVDIFGLPRWRFTFLAHGVKKDDMSRWLNTKSIDLFVTSSPAEFDAITSDGTPYVFTTKQVKLTGLPRFDGLLSKRAAKSDSERNLILIMPTWRTNLVGASISAATDREKRPGFVESEYAQMYSRLLSAEFLRDLATEHQLEVVFMPHPNMAPYLDDFARPDYIRVVSYDDADVQQLLACGRILVTDYSSMAFNAAAMDLPTIYFQFDKDAFYSGAHSGRRGYFDYGRDGFGPVCTTLKELEPAIADTLAGGPSSVEYAQRMHQTFAFHDLNNSARVFQAMKNLDLAAADQRTIPAPATAPANDAVGAT
jgi:glycosyltransferase involved in cell wall biosynthesis